MSERLRKDVKAASRAWRELEIASVVKRLRASALIMCSQNDLLSRTTEMAALRHAVVPLAKSNAGGGNTGRPCVSGAQKARIQDTNV